MSERTAVSQIEQLIPSLRRYAWSLLRNAADADDLVQDCLVRALDRVGSLRKEGDLRPWLFTIMHNLFASRWRRMANRARLFNTEAEGDTKIAPTQEATLHIQDVLRGLDVLPDEQREIVLLVAVEGFQYDEVARMLDIPLGTVMSRLCRARDRLAQYSKGA